MDSRLGLGTCREEDIYRVASQLAALSTIDEIQQHMTTSTSPPMNDLHLSMQTSLNNSNSINFHSDYEGGDHFGNGSSDFVDPLSDVDVQYDSIGIPTPCSIPNPNNFANRDFNQDGRVSSVASSDSLLKPYLNYPMSHKSDFSDRSDLSSISSSGEPYHNYFPAISSNGSKFSIGSYLLGAESNDETKAKIVGPGLQRAVRGCSSIFYIHTNTPLSSKYSFKVKILSRCGNDCKAELKQMSSTKVIVRYRPDYLGLHEISVLSNGYPAEGSPITVDVESKHEYQTGNRIKYCVEGDEQRSFTFNEPWGVCCNKEGAIFVSDRGNHTIRVFSSNFSYSHAIGSKGSKPGELNKPAGLDINSQDQIVVADKDNHRVQIFSIQGDVVGGFGENGSAPWQFNYPWSISITPQDAILVTDSRNGRISMYSSAGVFMKLIVEGNTILKNPRGIVYREIDNRIITADMNKHQIIVINTDSSSENGAHSNFSHPSYIGTKGKNPEEFQRPQGVTCDLEGFVLVCDSRNSRIQIIDLDGNFVTAWPIEAPDCNIPAQPMGITVTPWGDILVVDSKYNRVIVY